MVVVRRLKLEDADAKCRAHLLWCEFAVVWDFRVSHSTQARCWRAQPPE